MKKNRQNGTSSINQVSISSFWRARHFETKSKISTYTQHYIIIIIIIIIDLSYPRHS